MGKICCAFFQTPFFSHIRFPAVRSHPRVCPLPLPCGTLDTQNTLIGLTTRRDVNSANPRVEGCISIKCALKAARWAEATAGCLSYLTKYRIQPTPRKPVLSCRTSTAGCSNLTSRTSAKPPNPHARAKTRGKGHDAHRENSIRGAPEPEFQPKGSSAPQTWSP